MKKFIIFLANSQHYFVHALRIAIFISFTISAGVKAFSNQGDYIFSYIGAALILMMGTMTLLGIWFYRVGLIGGLFIFLGSLVALGFLIIGIGRDMQSPYPLVISFSGIARVLVLMAAGLICASDCAKQIFRDYVLRMGKA